ncbi:HK97 gp10 family phage protein [Paenibacillus sp. TAB 01]|uniref:HK97 gp10 family phage protein n=1 Tax=Paenibacillus sp. TAB 01 TaxID=3368988 RepID=UPI003751D9DB
MSSIGRFEFDELKELQQALAETERRFPGFVEECLNELAARLLAKVIARTPVDTGDLRKGWTIGQITRVGNTVQIEVINPVEYAMYVEYGHRTRNHKGWVEGRFMLTKSVDELERELSGILERKLDQFLKRMLGW